MNNKFYLFFFILTIVISESHFLHVLKKSHHDKKKIKTHKNKTTNEPLTKAQKKLRHIHHEIKSIKRILALFEDYKEIVMDDEKIIQQFLFEANQVKNKAMSLISNENIVSYGNNKIDFNFELENKDFSNILDEVNNLTLALNNTSNLLSNNFI